MASKLSRERDMILRREIIFVWVLFSAEKNVFQIIIMFYIYRERERDMYIITLAAGSYSTINLLLLRAGANDSLSAIWSD